jgi:hypothetical protein
MRSVIAANEPTMSSGLRALGLTKTRADGGFTDKTNVPYKLFLHEVGSAAWPNQSR